MCLGELDVVGGGGGVFQRTVGDDKISPWHRIYEPLVVLFVALLCVWCRPPQAVDGGHGSVHPKEDGGREGGVAPP